MGNIEELLLESIHTKWLSRYINESRPTVISSERRIGMTTIACAYILWHALFDIDRNNYDPIIGISSHNIRNSKFIMECISDMYNNLPSWLKNEIPATLRPRSGNITLYVNGRAVYIRLISIDNMSYQLAGVQHSLIYCDVFDMVQQSANGKRFMAMVDATEPNKLIRTATGYQHDFYN